MTTALQLMAAVFSRANMEETLTSFDTSQHFPFNNALAILNRAVDDLNAKGRYRFMTTSTALAYSAGVYQYSLDTLGVDSEAILHVERQLEGSTGFLRAINLGSFRKFCRRNSVQTQMPSIWTDYGDVLELNTIPDKDYSIKVWHTPAITRFSLATDTVGIPERYEYVLENMAYAWLLEELGRQDFPMKYQMAVDDAKMMKVNDRRLRSRPSQMPRMF